MKYRKQFLDTALERGIISIQGRQVAMDPFFRGDGDAVSLAARVCQEAMYNHPTLRDVGMLMAFGEATYPLLPVAAQAFPRGGGSRGFIHHETYHRYRLGERPNGDRYAILATMEDNVDLKEGEAFINKHLGTCVGAVILFSSQQSEEQDGCVNGPVLRVIVEQEAFEYWEANLDNEGNFARYQRPALLDLD